MPTSLLNRALDLPNLRLAWQQVAANKGVAGADDVTIKRFAREWEANLLRLRESVLAHSYRPKRLRHFRVPKLDGAWRTLSIPAVGDRVLQRAVLNVLAPRWERWFCACSYGYRPRRSLKDAVRQVAAQREAGLRWVLDADIERFFDSVDHTLLTNFLEEVIADDALLGLIALWLKAGRRHPNDPTGIPLGSVVSPLFSNLYLHQLDLALTRMNLAMVRYADDFIVQCATRAEVEEAQRFVAWALGELKLKLHDAKTRVVHFDDGFEFLGVHFEGNCLWYVASNKRIVMQGWPLRFRVLPIPPDGYA